MHKTQPKVRETPILEKIYEHWNTDTRLQRCLHRTRCYRITLLLKNREILSQLVLESLRTSKMATVERTSESIVRKVVLHPLRTFGSFNRYLGSRRLGSSIYPKFQMDSWKNIVRSSRSKKYTGHWIHYSHTFFLELILDNRSISLNTPRWYYILYVSTQFTNITSSSEINTFTISQDIEI